MFEPRLRSHQKISIKAIRTAYLTSFSLFISIYILYLRTKPYSMTIFRTFLIAIAMLTLCCCKSGNKERSILPDKASIKDGDIVLRKGTGFTSHAVAFADKSSDYSHCGIVMIKDGKPMVIHAVPDEPDFDGDKDRVKMEPLEKFFSSIRASKGRIMRFEDADIAHKSACSAEELFRRGILFDHDYNDRDTTEMYCSELVEHAFSRHGVELTKGIRHDISLPGMKFRHVIFPSDFIRGRKLKTVYTFDEDGYYMENKKHKR